MGCVGWLVKVRVDAAADNGDRRDSRFLEGQVIAAWEKPIRVLKRGQRAISRERLTSLGRPRMQ